MALDGLAWASVSSGCLHSSELNYSVESIDSSDQTPVMTAKIVMTMMEAQMTGG